MFHKKDDFLVEFFEIPLETCSKYFPPLTLNNISGQWYFEVPYKILSATGGKKYDKVKWLTNYNRDRVITGTIVDMPKFLRIVFKNINRMHSIGFRSYDDILVDHRGDRSIVKHSATVINAKIPITGEHLHHKNLVYGMYGHDNDAIKELRGVMKWASSKKFI